MLRNRCLQKGQVAFSLLGSSGFSLGKPCSLLIGWSWGPVWKPRTGEAGLSFLGFRRVVWKPSDTGEATAAESFAGS